MRLFWIFTTLCLIFNRCFVMAETSTKYEEHHLIGIIENDNDKLWPLEPFRTTEDECKKYKDSHFVSSWCFHQTDRVAGDLPKNCTGLQRDIRNNFYCCSDTRPIDIGFLDSTCPNRRITAFNHPKSDVILGNKISYLPCPKDKPLYARWGKCYPCDEKEPISITFNYGIEGWAKKDCPNRVVIDEKSFLSNPEEKQSCPADKPFRSENGECQSCDFDSRKPNTAEDCAKCSDHVMYGNYCALTSCPADKPLRDEYGKCQSCDYYDSIPYLPRKPYTPEECSKCPDLTLKNGYCVKRIKGD